VISGGRIIDPESKLDAVRNVGIRDGKIAAISANKLSGKSTIDAKGLVVAPGFIDLHSHAVMALPAARMQVMDGVTTALELESGVIPIAGTYDLLAKEGRPLNYGFSVAWTFSRAALAMGIPYEKFSSADWGPAYSREDWHGYYTPEKSKRVLEMVERGLREGALGVGANMGYMPEVNLDETYDIAKLTQKYGGARTFFHIRHNEPFGPNNNLGGHEEVIAVAAMTGARVHFCHLNSNATQRIPEMIAAVEKARSRGLDISWEAYPYGAANTMSSAAYLAPENLENLGITFSDIVYTKTGERIGSKERLTELRKEDPSGLVVVYLLDEKNKRHMALLDQAVTHRDSAIASDSVFWQVGSDMLQGDIWPLPNNTAGHPRSAGTFSRVIGSYVRSGKLKLMDAIRKASLGPVLN
jgi:N-acyl-D-glutamate deacylase